MSSGLRAQNEKDASYCKVAMVPDRLWVAHMSAHQGAAGNDANAGFHGSRDAPCTLLPMLSRLVVLASAEHAWCHNLPLKELKQRGSEGAVTASEFHLIFCV